MENLEAYQDQNPLGQLDKKKSVEEVSTEEMTAGSTVDVVTSSGSTYRISKIGNELYLSGGKFSKPVKIERLGAKADGAIALNGNVIIVGCRLECGGKEIPMGGVITTSVIKEIKMIS